MDAFPWGGFPSNATISGTSELFSTSVAMLGDAYQPYPEQWFEQKQPLQLNIFDQPTGVIPLDYRTTTHLEHPTIYTNSYENNSAFPMYHAEAMAQAQLRHQAAQQAAITAAVTEEARQKEQFFAQKIADSGVGLSPTVTIPINPHHTPGGDSGVGMVTPSRRPSSVCGSDVPGRSPITSSESGIENDGSPGGSEVNPSEEEGEGRVMCHACKGLYPSRRSLTGHIGRNEKCREIIDQVAAGVTPISVPDTNLRAAAMTNGHDGLSPICPHCDKFISHYKGNIRRHINSCGKNGICRKVRPDKEKEKKRRRRMDEAPPPVLHEGFEPTPRVYNPMAYNPTQAAPQTIPTPYASISRQEDRRLPEMQQSMHLQSGNVLLPTDPSPPNAPKRDEPPDDAYICGLCDFVTIYKGNMKRHLNTCHKSNECKDLKEWDRKLESMRASSMGMSREEMLQRLHLHRMNSTRGRKPGKRQLCQEVPPSQHLPQQAHNPQQGIPRMQHPHSQPGPQMPHSSQAISHQEGQHSQLPHPNSMSFHRQEAEFFAMPQMNQMHYGFDMGGHYIQ